MKSARSQIKEDVFKGATYNASKALKLGLIDQIGTLQDAINKVYELAETESNKKQKTMKNYTTLEEVIGATFSADESANGVFLTEDQADAVEQRLAGLPEEINQATEPLQTRITELEGNVATEQGTISAIESALNDVFEEAELDRGEMTATEAIAFLSEKLGEYGAKDGAKHTKTRDNAEQNADDSNNIVGGIDITAAMNN